MAENIVGADRLPYLSLKSVISTGRTRGAQRREMDAKEAEAIRQNILRAAETVLALLVAAEEAGDESEQAELPFRLTMEAWAALRVWADNVRSAELSEDSAGWWRSDLITVQSYVEGAAALATGTPVGLMLEGVKPTLKGMIADLRRDNFPDRGQYYPQLFMSGVRRFADALEEIYGAGEAAWFEATDRGNGVIQNRTAIEKTLNDFRHNSAALEGFAAALTGFIAPTNNSSWDDAVEYFRGVTYAEFIGKRERTVAAPPARDEAARGRPQVDAFMEGKSIAADMLAAVKIDQAGSDEADLRATYRGPGVAQNVVAREYLNQVIARPELLDGFAAALTGILLNEDDPELLRTATYEECVGGPDTRYVADQDDAQADQQHRLEPDDGLSAERSETVRQAGTFISRMVSFLEKAASMPDSRDWRAMQKAASVVMSGVSDPAEEDESLASRLDDAIESASAMFEEQPSTHFRKGGVLRQQDVGRLMVRA